MIGNASKLDVGLAGLEPATLGLEGRCSIQLSYNPIEFMMYRSDNISRDGLL